MSHKSYSERFRVKPDRKIDLGDYDPNEHDGSEGDPKIKEEFAHVSKKLADLQYKLYANRKHSVLICLQALDAGGKDGSVSHVCGSMNPQGCRVVSFKQPSHEELAHDFLWRIHKEVPQDGEIVVFNRSQYEDVLVVKVHGMISKDVCQTRYKRINTFEKGLVEHNTLVLKFFLHISKEEQLKRFKSRLDDPMKNWKISESDYTEREYWNDYTKAYEAALSHCSPEIAPWFIIPANHKWFRNLVIANILMEQLDALKLELPAPTVNLEQIRKQYHAAELDS